MGKILSYYSSSFSTIFDRCDGFSVRFFSTLLESFLGLRKSFFLLSSVLDRFDLLETAPLSD